MYPRLFAFNYDKLSTLYVLLDVFVLMPYNIFIYLVDAMYPVWTATGGTSNGGSRGKGGMGRGLSYPDFFYDLLWCQYAFCVPIPHHLKETGQLEVALRLCSSTLKNTPLGVYLSFCGSIKTLVAMRQLGSMSEVNNGFSRKAKQKVLLSVLNYIISVRFGKNATSSI
ncbi:hypothetical protein F5050DRAFT_1711583 [Lentinula boryana]|uniref:Uncharacterized protein n=1 Tax=Lentinula boryana TaxID=40481 RepID=A0ABQ8QF53_9AGAR|nr:hypothetical protein F5050DRAFT_1711583 [Lentinula boryana]